MAAAALPGRASHGPSWGIALGAAVLAGVAAIAGAGIAFGELDALWLTLTLAGAVAVLIDYRVGVVALMVMLPFASSQYFPRAMLGITGLNPFNLLLAATLGAWALRALGRRGELRRFIPRPLLWLYIAPIVVGGLIGARHADEIAAFFYAAESIHFVGTAGYLRDMLVKPLQTVLLALLIAAAVRDSARPERFIGPVVASAVLMSLLTMAFVFTALGGFSGVGALSHAANREFLSGIGMHANDLGRLYVVAYALMLFTWIESKSPGLKLTLLVAMALVTGAMILTFSRGAFFGFLMVTGLFALWRFSLRSMLLLGLGTVAALVLIPGVMDVVLRRVLLGFESGDPNAITAGRIDGIWLPVLPEILSSPLWGNGLGSVMWSGAMRSGAMLPVTHPHNAYLEALLDMGLVGLVLLCLYFAHVWKQLRRLGSGTYLSPALRGFFQGTAAALLAVLATGMAGSSLVPRPEYAFLWLAIGIMYGQLGRTPRKAGKPAS